MATVVPADEEKKKKPVTKYKTKYITKYKTLYKEKTVYVPVYDDPFWNPAVDGRSAHASNHLLLIRIRTNVIDAHAHAGACARRARAHTHTHTHTLTHSHTRLAGEGVGMPEASPMGARSYRSGAWYEWGKPRKNMLDALGGTLDSDADVDEPADLGVWWGDSLPTGRMASSLSDSDSF